MVRSGRRRPGRALTARALQGAGVAASLLTIAACSSAVHGSASPTGTQAPASTAAGEAGAPHQVVVVTCSAVDDDHLRITVLSPTGQTLADRTFAVQKDCVDFESRSDFNADFTRFAGVQHATSDSDDPGVAGTYALDGSFQAIRASAGPSRTNVVPAFAPGTDEEWWVRWPWDPGPSTVGRGESIVTAKSPAWSDQQHNEEHGLLFANGAAKPPLIEEIIGGTYRQPAADFTTGRQVFTTRFADLTDDNGLCEQHDPTFDDAGYHLEGDAAISPDCTTIASLDQDGGLRITPAAEHTPGGAPTVATLPPNSWLVAFSYQ